MTVNKRRLITCRPVKWAVENRNLASGESVRMIECVAEWAADFFCDRANTQFATDGRAREQQAHVVRDGPQ